MRVSTLLAASLATFVCFDAGIAAAESEADPIVRYDNGLTVGGGDDVASVKLGGRAQGRHTTERQGTDPSTSEWAAKRLRLSAKGHLGTPRLKYYGQLAFEDGFEVRDAFLDFAIVPDVLRIRAGKGKMPGARHHLNSSGRLALVDRAITHKAFDSSRGIGLLLQNGVEGKQLFGWAVGAFLDDTNRLRFADRADGAKVVRPFEPVLVARVGVNLGGLKVTDEINWEGGAGAAIGAFAVESLDTRGDGDGRLRTGVDWLAGYGGMTASGDIQLAVQHTDDGSVYDGVGFHQQLAILLFGHVSPAVRFAVVNPVGDAVQTELAGGLTGYLWRHRLKLGADVASLRDDGAQDEVRLRLQAQVIF
jgi:hypothetical protein